MKKICLLICVWISCVLSSSAQFSRGTIFVGPTLGTSSYQSAADNLDYSSGNNATRTSSSKTYAFSIGPQVGVFVNDHLVLGGSVNYSHSAKDTHTNTSLVNGNLLASNSSANTSTFNTGPFLRYYYFDNLSKNIFYTQLNGTVGTGHGVTSGSGNNNINSTYQSDGTTSGIFSWSAGGSVGLTHFFSDFIGMDIAVGYSYNSTTSNSQNVTNTTSNATEIVTHVSNTYKETLLTHGVTLGLGFHWFFRKTL
jgi:hypothetical protein